ncbi:phosphatidylinositol-specific phospholipase C, partial [Candidatus Bathyarchaeota archaeon]|nr:phosphatidylinositol-specific phospholipase C [Candidatus Bathyarchaeota archaeon]
MVPLTIRNLTPTPLTLTHTARFAATSHSTGTFLSNACGLLTSLFHATDFPTAELHPAGDALSSSPAALDIAPFQTRQTDVPAPGSGEVLRLSLTARGVVYETDAPSPTGRSAAMRRGEGEGEEFTAVYLPAHAFLAVFSSTHPSSWMAHLPDPLLLSSLSIPGTHNSPTHYIALPSVRCQVAPLRAQLSNGVRFLDVRVSARGNSDRMPLVHAAFPVALWGARYLDGFLEECYAFLDDNPRECLVLSLKREGMGSADDEAMSRYLLDGYIAKDTERWFTGANIPRLGEVRGKIVLLRRFRADERAMKGTGAFGIDASCFPDNCSDGAVLSNGTPLLRVQDLYSLSCGDVSRKAGLVLNHLARAASSEGQLFVNFLSASNFFVASCWPERVAARVNPAVVEYLCMRHGVGR